MAVTKIKPIKSTLKKALDYIQNPDKTDGKMLVSSFGCSPETADIEFEFTISAPLLWICYAVERGFEGKRYLSLASPVPRSGSRINQGSFCPYCVT